MRYLFLVSLLFANHSYCSDKENLVVQFGTPLILEFELSEIKSNSFDIDFIRKSKFKGKCLTGHNLIPIGGSNRLTISDCHYFEIIKEEDNENITINIDDSFAKTYFQTQRIQITISMKEKFSDEYEVSIVFMEGPTDLIIEGKNFYFNPKFTLRQQENMPRNINTQEVDEKNDERDIGAHSSSSQSGAIRND